MISSRDSTMTGTLLAIWIKVANFDSFTVAIQPFN
jgi:hypothetical protein